MMSKFTNVNINIDEELLNYFVEVDKLKEENKQLKQERDYWKNKFKDGREENKQLKKTIDDLNKVSAEICATLILQSVENEFIYDE